MKITYTMMNRYLALLLSVALLLSSRWLYAQQSPNTVKFKVTYNSATQTYTAWAVPDYTTPNSNSYNTGTTESVSTSQFSLKVPFEFVIQNIVDVNGTWDKAPPKYGSGLPLTDAGGTVVIPSQDYSPAVLDPAYAYYAIGKSPTTTNIGAFAIGQPVALFTFQGNGCFGPIQPLPPGDPFIQAAADAYSFNVPNNFNSASGQPSSGNQDPLEQYLSNTGAAANCSVFPPLVTPDIANTSRNKPVSGNVLTNDSDPNAATATGATLTASLVSQPTSGTVVLNIDGNYSYTPPTGFTGTVSFCYSATNTAGLSASTCVSINIIPDPSPTGNNPPIANNDNTQTTAATSVTVAVLANDTDPDAGPPDSATMLAGQLSNPTIVSPPSVGTAVVNANGTVTYTPPANFTGVVSFPYQVCDQGASQPSCATALVTVTIQPTPPVGTTLSPVAVDDALLASVNTLQTGTVAANDRDPAGLPLTYTTGQPTSGTVVMSPTGSYTYTPATGFTGPTSFTYSVCNPAGKCTVATVSVLVQSAVPAIVITGPVDGTTVASLNPPVSGTATPGSSVTVSGPNGQTCVTQAASPSGIWSCTSLTFVNGPTSVSAISSLNGVMSAPVVSSFTVAVPPTVAILSPATNTTVSNNPPVSGTATPNAVVTLTGGPGSTGGPVSVTADNTGAYSTTALGFPAGANSVTAVATNAGGVSSPAIASFTVISPAAPPSLTVNSPVNVTTTTTPTLAGTATPGSPVVIAGPGNTTLCTTTASVSGTFSCPVSVPVGPNSLTVTASGPGGSTSMPVTFTAVGPPSLTVSSPVNVTTTTTPTLAGTATPGSPVVIAGPGNTTLCTTTASVSGTFSCPVSVPVGPNSLTVTACTVGGCTTATISFTALAPPTIVISSPFNSTVATTNPPISGTATALASVTVVGPNGQRCVTTASASGTWTCASLTFTAGIQSVTAIAANAGGQTLATSSFTVTTTAQAPVVTPDIANTTPGVPVSGNVLTNDIDPQGGPLMTSLLSQPTSGTVVLNPDGTYIYTPPTGFTGVASFCYLATNSAALSASTCVSITVNPGSAVNLPPVAINDQAQTPMNQPIVLNILANDSDPNSAVTGDGQLGAPTLLGQPASGSALINANGTVTYTPPMNFTGVVSFSYRICDKATVPLCATALISVTVVSSLKLPVAVNDSLVTSQNTAKSSNVSTNDYDPQSLAMIYSSGQPQNGTVVMATNGIYTYTPTDGYTGPDSFTYSVCNIGLCAKATVYITVQPSPVVVLRLKVLLQGALVGSSSHLMRDDLRRQGFLPLTEPYTALGSPRFTHINGGGGETMPASVTAQGVGTGNAVVDWVFVELRSPANLSLVVATRSAMVQRDGDVVLASDGVSPLSFTGLTGSRFYVSVKHRNHLGVMTASAIPLSTTGTLVDFTTMSGSQLWNTVVGSLNYEGLEQIGMNGQQALWAGDASHNGQVKYQGTANDLITIFGEVIGAQDSSPLYNYDQALGYYFGDVNLDGKVKYQGTTNDTSLIFTNVLTNYQSLNGGQLYNFDWMIEQIP